MPLFRALEGARRVLGGFTVSVTGVAGSEAGEGPGTACPVGAWMVLSDIFVTSC